MALVIGNDSYKSLPDLNNARTDARGMAAKLKELGWSVILKQDASRRDISRSLADFEGRLKDAEVGLVFYAGHGIQKDGANYLVPSDARVEIEQDLHLEGVKSKEFLEVMKRAGAPLNIVILDACRDNPLPKRSRSGARGLSTPVIPKGIKGTAILYSAAPGQVAQDGPSGGHGVFTGELLKVLDRPGLKLEEVFKQTATKVAAATNGSQDPWINSSVKGDFFFQERVLAQNTTQSSDKEAMFWVSIKDSENSDAFEAYLSKFPHGVFVPLANIKIKELSKYKKVRSNIKYKINPLNMDLTASSRVNVRSLPSISAAKIGQFESGTQVRATGTANVDGDLWYRIKFSGREGYVFGALLIQGTTKSLKMQTTLESAGSQRKSNRKKCTIKGNVNSKGNRIYHLPGGQFYKKIRIKGREGDRCFKTEEQAKKAGFRRSKR